MATATLFDGTVPIPAIETAQGGLFDRAVLLSVSFRSWGRSRKLAPSQYQVSVDDKAKRTRASKKLLEDATEIKAIATLMAETRAWLDARAAVCSALKGGVYLWPVASLVPAFTYLEAQVVILEDLVHTLVSRWDALVAADMASLQDVADARDYPSALEIAASYSISWVALEAGAPGALARVDQAAYEDAQRRAGELWESALDAGVSALVGELDGMLGHLVDVLTPAEDGKAKRFHATTVSKLDEWVELYRGKAPILQRADLDAAVDRVRAMLRGVDAAGLKGQDAMRATVTARAGEIRETLSGLVETAPRRMMALFDEEL